MKIKHAREVKVGVVAIVCIFLLFFGFNFLKGKNIFSTSSTFYGKYEKLSGLQEQSPVYIRGYKVGQVDDISYDFSQDSAFTVVISIDHSIVVPEGSTMALVSDGLLGGMAIEIIIPTGEHSKQYASGDQLPTTIVPSLMDNLQDGVLLSLTETLGSVQGLVDSLAMQLEGDHIANVLENLDSISGEMTVASTDLKKMTQTRLPSMLNHVDGVVKDIKAFTTTLNQVDIQGTVQRVDTAIAGVNTLIEDMRSPEGTVGKLLYDPSLYNSLNATVGSADSLVTDLKAHPKRYVHFSIFGQREKRK